MSHTDLTIRDTWLHHLTVNKGLSKHSLRAYKVDSQGYIEYLHQINQRLITSQKNDVRGWFRSLLAPPKGVKPVSAATLNRKRSTIRNLHQWMILHEYGTNDPTSNVAIPKIPKRNPKFMTIPEAAKVVENPIQEGHFRRRNQAILEMIYGAGLRVSEAANLDVEHLDFSRCMVHVVEGKGKKDRIVPFGPPAAQAIQAMLQTSDHPKTGALFLNKFGNRLSTRSIWQICNESGKSNGVYGLHPHAFRHTCATHLLDAGADLRSIQEQLGHSSLSTTQRYTQINTAALLESYRKAHPRIERPTDEE